MKSKAEIHRSPGFPQAQYLPGTTRRRVLAHVTLGVVLTLVVVPGVPVMSSICPLASAGDPATAEESVSTVPAQDVADAASSSAAKIDRWITDLAADSWKSRQLASESLIGEGESVREAMKRALASQDPEVVAQAQSILKALDRKKQASRSGGDGTLGQKIRTTTDGPIAIDFDGLPVPVDPIPFPGGHDPLDGIRRAEEQLRRWEQQMFRRFPSARSRLPLGGQTLKPRQTRENRSEHGWSTSSEVRITRNGQVILESHNSGSRMTLEPLGLTLEEVHPSLRAHLPGLAEGGVIVSRVRDLSPASIGDWKVHDILTAMDKTPIRSLEDAQQRLQELMNPDSTIHIIRRGQAQILGAIGVQEPKPKRF
ncbi:MAG: PDZ domain-containing protein [Planctomycetota bacterium]|nr:PDZ domain-containing protein [Planctomycetota bacterium]